MASDASANSFEHLGLSADLLKAVTEAGYETPTPIQRQAIPAVLQGRDVLGIAQTGTGKTASFVLPMLDVLAQGRTKARMPRSLIIEPTRELAAQVADNFEIYGKHHKLSMALLIGGVSFADQEAKLERGVDVLIATPGRLLDHFERGKLMLNGVSIFVVDEADRMMDMGFIPDVERIFKLLPSKSQTLFFSATMPKAIKRLTDQFLNDPKTIEVSPPASAAETVEQRLVMVSPRNKMKALKTALGEPDVATAIVFCNRKRDVDTVTKGLKRDGHPVGQLHGDMSQPERMDTLQSLKDDTISVLVASDVAARGLDIAAVSHVINFDVPHNSDDYVHRIGRTGRAGRSGIAITIATPDDQRGVDDIRKALGVALDPVKLPGVPAARLPSDATGEPATDAKDDEATTGAAEAKPTRRRRRPKSRDGDTAAATGETPAAKTDAAPASSAKADAASAPQPARERDTRSRSSDARRSDQSRSDSTRDDGGRNGRGRRGGRDDDRPVVGLGDHVPAFLLRPVPKRPKTTAADEADLAEADALVDDDEDLDSTETDAPKTKKAPARKRTTSRRTRAKASPETADAPDTTATETSPQADSAPDTGAETAPDTATDAAATDATAADSGDADKPKKAPRKRTRRPAKAKTDPGTAANADAKATDAGDAGAPSEAGPAPGPNPGPDSPAEPTGNAAPSVADPVSEPGADADQPAPSDSPATS
ncbi:superfamily II DNA/RNA helicase [Rhodothalassium salexigens DSM 2132]|uniref:DEAD-box ATP-dependent RNA helicase RhpA n=1 Tax=Rhodothalassium salexigens DSM 2132 TaxID=1188247 RepID=A0A4R2PW73_RHOSA|nr:DEAD/DEAH box helicase [Rhodothalassium salexigens]MBB4210237.1 superfamily II DNA/RNA helicase [Rhodothalassium salexigens DSM 2132]MBK1638677.1 hypothetical protein [Rhodothalassium salexigens DSM 2132]TCP38401.1 superfamily II DNA/RNA helicase [Rhodothalassium salexigens DSM 2132]